MLDTRRMEVAILAAKRAQTIIFLEEWIPRTTFNLREISSLHGQLESLTRYIKWAQPLFFALQNAIRFQLLARYHVLQRRYNASNRATSLEASLTPALLHRLKGLIAGEKAQILWSNRAPISMNVNIRNSLHTILASLKDPVHRWAQPIGFIIPRDHHFKSVGDASGLAGGAYCEFLCSGLI
jgi:hypothetical protein